MRCFSFISREQFNIDFASLDVLYEDLILPSRKTKFSAGYDFYIPYDIVIKPNEEVLIPTGVKVMLNCDEFLAVYIRSSLGFKYNLRMCNQVGIIDSDYYNNVSNEGHILLKIRNEGNREVVFKKNDRIVQGVIQKYYLVDNDEIDLDVRDGGIGSTDKELKGNG